MKNASVRPVSLKTAADTEQKLSEARRLFSLRDFLACEALLLQILETDPLNSKAKALKELTAIKLHRRQLYRKLIDPRVAGSPSYPGGHSTAGSTAPNLASQSPAVQGVPDVRQSAESQANPASVAGTDVGGAVRSGKAPTAQNDTVRERTIAALVQLFNDKERQLEDWHDPRFQTAPPETLEAAESSTQTSADLPIKDSSLPMSWEPSEDSEQIQASEQQSRVSSDIEQLPNYERAGADESPKQQQESDRSVAKPLSESTIPLLSPKIVEDIRQLKHDTPAPQVLTDSQYESSATVDRALTSGDEKVPVPETAHLSSAPLSPVPDDDQESKVKPKRIIQLPNVSPFEQITSPKKVEQQRLVERKLQQRSEDLKSSEAKTVTIAKIKKYFYEEEYELCARELDSIKKRFPESEEIQAFVENTSKRLSELQRTKGFEVLATELMMSANFHYQQGKLPEALIATKEVLRVLPEHQQARQFAELIQKRLEKERKRALSVDKLRYCRACGVAVEITSQYCHHCGRRLT